LATTPGFCGRWNDKTIVNYDAYVHAIRTLDAYTKTSYILDKADGTRTKVSGVYLITDGGYHLWRVAQCPSKTSSVKAVVRYSKALESVRKDVECVFGKLKGRFRILKLPNRFNTSAKVDNCWFTACILHNRLMQFDGLDKRWEAGADYGKRDGLFNDLAENEEVLERHAQARMTSVHPDTDHTRMGAGRGEYWMGTVEREPGHFTLKAQLVEHYNVCWAKRDLPGWDRK
jgi:hypothetical protein